MDALVPTSIPANRLPRQDANKAMLYADRWVRDAEALRKWSVKAKKCVQFVEGDQWDEADTKQHEKLKRPMITINKLNRLLRLMYGFYASNRGELGFAPGNDGVATEQIAEVLSKLSDQERRRLNEQWIDDEVIVDGWMTGRGFWDVRLNYENNDLGEQMTRAVDPFSVYIQHDGDAYDVQKHDRITVSRWASVDEIGSLYGEEAAKHIMTIVSGDGWHSFPQNYYWNSGPEVTPERKFGGEDDVLSEWWTQRSHDFIDHHLKNVRVLDIQHKVRSKARVFVDLETGDWKLIPDFWDDDKIGKVLYHAEKMKNPIKVVNRVINRHRWTTLVGDITIWDDWSPYDWFTIVPYFPYFRRGKTRGMFEDLLDPQREVNKKRSLRVEILGRTANGGYLIHEDAMRPEQRANLKEFGSTPGVTIEWTGDEPWKKPERLDHQPRNLEAQSQEQDSSADILETSGINQSALGDLDRVQSGKAVIERKKQAVAGAMMYFENFSRSMVMKGQLQLKNYQRSYTEERIVRVVGETGHLGMMLINQRIMSPDGTTVLDKLNDITFGKYDAVIKQAPGAETFEATQFEEMLTLFESLGQIGQQIAMTNPGLIVDMSTLPRKNEWKQAIQQAVGMQNAEEERLRREEMILQSGATNRPNKQSPSGQVLPSPVPAPPPGPLPGLQPQLPLPQPVQPQPQPQPQPQNGPMPYGQTT